MTNLPLYQFFETLQKHSSFYVGVDDYAIFLEILMREIVIEKLHFLKNREKLLRLCKLLWLKPEQNTQAFTQNFDYAWSVYLYKETIETNPVPNETKQADKSSDKVENESSQPINQTDEDKEDTVETDSTSSNTPLIQEEKRTDEIDIFLNFSDAEGKELRSNEADDLSTYFHFVPNYIPYPQRDISQIWRSLHKERIVGVTNEIDISKTIDTYCQRGALQQIIYQPKLKNEATLITLIDINDEMIAFKALAQAIANNANQHANINNAVYYFKNVPKQLKRGSQFGDYCLYKNQIETKYQELYTIFNQKDTGVLIISDIDAATNYMDIDRLEDIERFLDEVRKYTQKIVWLNPMPQDRWKGTSADILQHIIPMYEANLEGLRQAIQILKGTKHWITP